MANIIEIEVDTPNNNSLHFLPIGRDIRGRFDYARVAEPQAALERSAFPLGIPSQRLGIDTDEGVGYIVEMLYEPQHKAIRATLERKAFGLPPERETFRVGADTATWLYWMKRAVESGVARLVRGKFPEKIE